MLKTRIETMEKELGLLRRVERDGELVIKKSDTERLQLAQNVCHDLIESGDLEVITTNKMIIISK